MSLLASDARVLRNARATADPGTFRVPDRRPLQLHRRLPGFAPTPLVDLAGGLPGGVVDTVMVKDESARLGLPSFKVLGASWALVSTLCDRLGTTPERHCAEGSPAEWFRDHEPVRLVAATDGNHGRAVAYLARLFGLPAKIYVPAQVGAALTARIAAEGAEVEVLDASYDEAVSLCAEMAGPDDLVVSDTAWPGYEEIPTRVVEGYSTMLWEVEDALAADQRPGPDVVLVQIGVGALATAVVHHFHHAPQGRRPLIVGVEPLDADCAWQTAAAGRDTRAQGPHRSSMTGLHASRCSLLAVDAIVRGIDAFVAIDDEPAREAQRLLGRGGIDAGATGAAGLAGLLALARDPDGRALLEERGCRRALVFNTEAAQAGTPAQAGTEPSASAEHQGEAR